MLFVPGDTRYISAKKLLQAFASLYSISRGDKAAKLVTTELEDDKQGEMKADIITYGTAYSLTKGTYKKY